MTYPSPVRSSQPSGVSGSQSTHSNQLSHNDNKKSHNNIYGQFARVNSVVTMVLGGAGISGNLLSVIVLSRPVMY